MLTLREKEAVIEAALDGLGPTAVSRKLGLSHGQVSGVIQRARMNGVPIMKHREAPDTWGGQKFVQVVIPETVAAQYEEAGRRRRIKGTCLIREVLSAVVEDDLFDAVLEQ